MSLQVVILAAGQGKRMYSSLPKVLHPLAGKPMLRWVIELAQALNPDAIHVVIGHGGGQVKEALADLEVNWVSQDKQLGTGHALHQALPFIARESEVLVLSGDVPLTRLETLRQLVDKDRDANLTLLVAKLVNPFGFGRILRDEQGHIQSIREEKDASAAERSINEIYTGICCAKAADLNRWLPALDNSNAQGEYYLTDIIGMAVAEGARVNSLEVVNPVEIQGVNNRLQLQELERSYQRERAESLMLAGVSIADASRLDIRGEVECGKDVQIDVNVVLKGRVVLGDRCVIAAGAILTDVVLAPDCKVHPYSVLEGCQLGEGSEVGPFARLRPGTQLAAHCKIGNFVETKKAVFGEGSKASHLSYLGDVEIGQAVNIGAGTITCNYDGVNKHQTIIEDGAFIGSDTQLVAPVRVGKNATIGAGSTIRKDAPAEELTLTVSTQKSIPGWKRPVRKKLS